MAVMRSGYYTFSASIAFHAPNWTLLKTLFLTSEVEAARNEQQSRCCLRGLPTEQKAWRQEAVWHLRFYKNHF